MERIEGKPRKFNEGLDLADRIYSRDAIMAYKSNESIIEGYPVSLTEIWIENNVMYEKNYIILMADDLEEARKTFFDEYKTKL